MTDDLFHPHDPEQEAYADALKRQWEEDCAYLHSQGVTPSWIETDQLLDRDERSILDWAIDNAGSAYDQRKIAHALGYLSIGNFKASLDKCANRKLIEFKTVDGELRMCLTSYGRWVYDSYEEEMGWDDE